MSATEDNKPLVGSPEALGRLFSGGLLQWRQFPMRLNRAQRIARRKEIFDSFTRTIGRTPHRVQQLAQDHSQKCAALPVEAWPSWSSFLKRDAARRREIRRSVGIPNSNRKPRRGPSAEYRADIKRREAKRIAHEALTKFGIREATP